MTTETANLNRSSEVRTRRQKRSSQNLERVHVQARNPVSRPVVGRVGGLGTPILRRTASKPRRWFAVSLAGQREVVFQGMPVIRPGWRLASGVLLVAVLALAIFLLATPAFQVSAMEWKGVNRLNKADLEKISGIINTPIFLVNPAEVQSRLKKGFEDLSMVSVTVDLPNKVKVSVIERTPVLAWEFKNLSVWVDGEGTIIPSRGDLTGLVRVKADMAIPLAPKVKDEQNQAAVIPTLTPNPTGQIAPGSKINSEVMLMALTLNTQLPSKGTLLYNQVDGLGWSDPRGWNAYFGRTMTQLDLKMAEYQSIVANLMQLKLKPKLINVKILDEPYVVLER